MNNILPPLPPSDQDSLDRNRFNGFYKVRARDFWGENEIIREEVAPDKKCDHDFKPTPEGARCKKCNFGLIGFMEVKDGKLFHQGERINL